MTFLPAVGLCLGIFTFIIFLVFSIESYREEEHTAFRRGIFTALFLPLPFLLPHAVASPLNSILAGFLIGVTVLILFVLLLPVNSRGFVKAAIPKSRIDERDTMFSRKDLKQGSVQFEEYYSRHPEKLEMDNIFRSHPGLMQKGAALYDPVSASAAEASFKTVKALHNLLDRDRTAVERVDMDPEQTSEFIKKWAIKLGAVSCGITELQDYHLYSTAGRGKDYGKPVNLSHRFAIAITVEMDKSMLARGPKGPTLMESAQQYLNAGVIAVQIAEYLRNLGHSARPHIDGSYSVVCPLVARDAGLGEIGRMGLLMTPELGPRVRLAVVTTDMILSTDVHQHDPSVSEFCRICKKCADACPGQAIPHNDQQEINGIPRWQINSEACYTLWCKLGTDCGRCVSVCPYSHPDTLMHNLVRAGLKRSPVFRYFALRMDDFFYGRKPASLPTQNWIKQH